MACGTSLSTPRRGIRPTDQGPESLRSSLTKRSRLPRSLLCIEPIRRVRDPAGSIGVAGRGTVPYDRPGEQRVAIEVRYVRDMDVHFSDCVRAGLHQHVLPCPPFRIKFQRSLVILGSLAILLQAVVCGPGESMSFAGGVYIQLRVQQSESVAEPAFPRSATQHLHSSCSLSSSHVVNLVHTYLQIQRLSRVVRGTRGRFPDTSVVAGLAIGLDIASAFDRTESASVLLPCRPGE